MKSRFITVKSENGEESEVRNMDASALRLAREDLKAQYELAQEDFVKALNQQLTLATLISAIEYEEERRVFGSTN